MSFGAFLPRLFGLSLAVTIVACGAPESEPQAEADYSAAVTDSVQDFFESIPATLADEGPIAWPDFFEGGPDFFMASDGALVFPNSDSAAAFVRGLSRKVSTIQLRWEDLRVTPLAPGAAVVAAAYREAITDTTGAEVAFGGYMTGVARHRAGGWRIQNLHWSSPVPTRE